jgi:hypothetical protein
MRSAHRLLKYVFIFDSILKWMILIAYHTPDNSRLDVRMMKHAERYVRIQGAAKSTMYVRLQRV